VILDAEHFFDGFRDDPDHALAVLRAAAGAGATTLVLCDTNGGTLPTELKAVVARVVREFPDVEVGIHTHNDAGCGVANALARSRLGRRTCRGPVNGVGRALWQLRPRHHHRQPAT
jgi:2-isopropylmalate synthase